MDNVFVENEVNHFDRCRAHALSRLSNPLQTPKTINNNILLDLLLDNNNDTSTTKYYRVDERASVTFKCCFIIFARATNKAVANA